MITILAAPFPTNRLGYLSVACLIAYDPQPAHKETEKITWKPGDISEFWSHWQQFQPDEHPACQEKQHHPIGFSGDDARYTLAGSKLIVMMISLVLQHVESFFDDNSAISFFKV